MLFRSTKQKIYNIGLQQKPVQLSVRLNMLVTFQKFSGGTVAINPKFVMMVEETHSGTNIIMSDGGTTKVTDTYFNVVGVIQGQLNN